MSHLFFPRGFGHCWQRGKLQEKKCPWGMCSHAPTRLCSSTASSAVQQLGLSVELLASSWPGFEEAKKPQLKYLQCCFYSCTFKIVFSAVAVNGSLSGLYVLPALMCLSLQACSVFEAELWKSLIYVELCQEKGTESEKTNQPNQLFCKIRWGEV